jgi:hypothetical protein
MAVVWMQEGASFREVATTLVEEGDFDAEEALRVTMRAFRGSDGTQKGLGRERVYLEAYLRVKALLEEDPGSEQVLAAGQIATHAVSTLETHVHRGAS